MGSRVLRVSNIYLHLGKVKLTFRYEARITHIRVGASAVSRLAVSRLVVSRLVVSRLVVSRLVVSRLAVLRLAVSRLNEHVNPSNFWLALVFQTFFCLCLPPKLIISIFRQIFL